MNSSLILGGTKGLGRALAAKSLQRGFPTTVVGRSTADAAKEADLAAASLRQADLSDPTAFRDVLREGDRFTHVFLVAGNFLRRPLVETSYDTHLQMANLHLLAPIELLKAFHRSRLAAKPLAATPGQPYHLVVISSTSSYRIRENEEMYCALQAAKAHFTRNWAGRMTRDLPGSKVTLVLPGGMKTGLFDGTGQDTSGYMDPLTVADIIWDRVLQQQERFRTIVMERRGSEPDVSDHAPAPHDPLP